jgi:hypothetical protein
VTDRRRALGSFEETNAFSGFAVEHLVLDASAWTSSTALLEAYQLWSRERGLPQGATSLTFFRLLRDSGGGRVKGFRRGVAGAQIKGYSGVRLKI